MLHEQLEYTCNCTEITLNKWNKLMEGASGGEWILIDCGDFIVNIFSVEKREYYNLDGLYQSS